jgi:hypothetical protein
VKFRGKFWILNKAILASKAIDPARRRERSDDKTTLWIEAGAK